MRRLAVGSAILLLALVAWTIFWTSDVPVDSQLISWALPMSFAVMSAALAATLWSRARGHLTQERFESLTILDLITALLGGVVGVILVGADGTESTSATALTVLAFLTSVLSIWSVLAHGTFKVVASTLVLLASLSLAIAVP